jgi:hypothetical protein
MGIETASPPPLASKENYMTAFYKTKDWYKSKTILASIATVLLGTAALFGVHTDASQASSVVDVLFIALGLITGYGRATATTAIGSTAPVV